MGKKELTHRQLQKRLGAGQLAVAALAAAALWMANPASASEGILTESHGDTFHGESLDPSFSLATAHGYVPLTDRQATKLVGQQVAITDTDPGQAGVQGQAQPTEPDEHLQDSPPPGPQTVLVLILTTPDDPNPAAPDAATAKADVFTNPDSVAAYYAQQSSGATTLVGRVDPVGDVLGPISLGTNMQGCPYESIANEADQHATAMGYSPSAYAHVIYVMPNSSQCDFGGRGQLPGTRVWSNGYLGSSVLAHELGHNMGAHHANSLSCTDEAGNLVAYSSSCSSTEYGDPFDVMGSSRALMGAFHRYQIGQLPASQVVSLRHSATIPVASSEDFAQSGARLVLVPIKIPHQALHDYFAIDARAPLAPFDFWTGESAVSTGLTIRKVNDSALPILQTQLINTNPLQPVEFSGQDSPLQPGKVFTDGNDGISIVAGTDSLGMLTATVSMPTLSEADDVPPTPPPSLSLWGNTNGVHLSWTPGSDDVAVDHYQVTRNAQPTGTTTDLSFLDPNVRSLTTVSYAVSTVDTSGNVSPPITISTSLNDATPPTQPTGLTAQCGKRRLATIRWAAASDNRGVTDYRIEQDEEPVASISGTAVQVDPRRHTHRYTIIAHDAAENESAPGTLLLSAKPKLHYSLGKATRVHGRRRIVALFRAPGACGVRVRRGTKQIAAAPGGRVSVPLLVTPTRHVRLTIIVTGSRGDERFTRRVP